MIISCKKYSVSKIARSVVEESLVESGQPLGILKTLRRSTGPGDGLETGPGGGFRPKVSCCILI